MSRVRRPLAHDLNKHERAEEGAGKRSYADCPHKREKAPKGKGKFSDTKKVRSQTPVPSLRSAICSRQRDVSSE